MEIEFGDTPVCLANIAKKIADMEIDLVMNESKSYQQCRKTWWDVVAGISRCSHSVSQIKQSLLQLGFMNSIRMVRIASHAQK